MQLSPKRITNILLTALISLLVVYTQKHQTHGKPRPSHNAAECRQFDIDPQASRPLRPVSPPSNSQCKSGLSQGLPISDPNCTPGAYNPSVTLQVLTAEGFRTACLRNKISNETMKAETYQWYGIAHPKDNHGPNMVCELDHLIPLELGGADSLDNIWPECGPDGVELDQRNFKQKDLVENYLTAQVKAGEIKLEDAQRGIAANWTQYLEAAREFCETARCN